ncbi:hypothetical protein F4810DRAFT_708108 [Camillea tinctor]|nr:hypothetical protein F4810DRAFT_708108 [Camillea tinctor]
MAARMLLATSALLASQAAAWTIDFPPVATNGSVCIEKVSILGPGALDAPKFNVTANKTSADWWYFDAVSTMPGDESTVEIVFFNDPDIASQPLAVQEPGLTFTIHLDSPALGVYGTFIIKSTGTPHYPCGPMAPGVTEAILLTFFWANADPTVDLTIDGVPVKSTSGIGLPRQELGGSRHRVVRQVLELGVLVANMTKHIVVLDEVVHRGLFEGCAHFEEFAWGILFD